VPGTPPRRLSTTTSPTALGCSTTRPRRPRRSRSTCVTPPA
jgi:hypothetical protein